MKVGIALLGAGAADGLREAIRHFDAAIEMRRQLPLAGNPIYRYGLAAGWINRGDALTKLNDGALLADAIRSYTVAIDLLEGVPAGDDGKFARRLAIAWLNCGHAVERREDEASLDEAVRCYQAAIDRLSMSDCTGYESHRLVLASAWINLGNAWLRREGIASITQICEAAQTALFLIAASESEDLAAADASLKAHHILCQAMTARLDEATKAGANPSDIIADLTDAVEEALCLARSWEKKGVMSLRPLATHFFHFGALLYEKHQVHFLAEFLLDYLDPERPACFTPQSESWIAIARESLSRVRSGLRNRSFTVLATPQGLRELEILEDARVAETRLQVVHELVAGREGGSPM